MKISSNVSHLVYIAQKCLLVEPRLYNSGMAWYGDALDFAHCAGSTYPSYSIQSIIGCIAALSPQLSWGRNKELALRCFDRHALGLPLDGQTTANLTKVCSILDNPTSDPLSFLGGLKVRAFYTCISTGGHTDEVCVDRHAVAAYQVPGDAVWASMTPGRYAAVAKAYREAAAILGVTPAQAQAIVWCAWRQSAV